MFQLVCLMLYFLANPEDDGKMQCCLNHAELGGGSCGRLHTHSYAYICTILL